jgi:hypothetical protein
MSDKEKAPLYQFILGDPETKRASARKVIVYVLCLSILAILVRGVTVIVDIDSFKEVWGVVEPIFFAVFGFYFGKSIANHQPQK